MTFASLLRSAFTRALFLGLALSPVAHAEKALITQFTVNGAINSNFPNSISIAGSEGRDIVQDGAFRLIKCGTFVDSSGARQILVSRLLSNNANDGSYGFGGLAVVSFPFQVSITISGCDVDSHNRVVVAFKRDDLPKQWWTARFTEAGLMDPGYGFGGLSAVDFPEASGSAQLADVRFSPDDKVVLAGTVNSNVTAVRITEFGVLDSAYGASGKARIDLVPQCQAMALVVDERGRAVIAGNASNALVVRFRNDGAIDTEFARFSALAPGALSFIAAFERANAIDIDLADRIVIAGKSRNGRMMVTRVFADGNPDPSFNSSALKELPTPPASEALDVKVGPNGKVLLAGYQSLSVGGFFIAVSTAIVVRIRDDGVIDTFGQNGVARQPGTAPAVFSGLFVDVLNRPTVVGKLF